MGNCCEPPNKIDHFVYIRTGDIKNQLDAVHLLIDFQDIKGKSAQLGYDLAFKSGFERGQIDIFQAAALNHFTDLLRIELKREGTGETSPAEADWFCEHIMVNNRKSEKCFYFPMNRWIASNQRIKIELYDSMLPQVDLNKEQRDEELRVVQELYQYGQSAPDLPVQVSTLPPYEQFSDEYKFDILNAQFQLLNKAGISRLPKAPWDSLEELLSIYVADLPEPVGIDRWSNDLCFGAQRLIGCNPLMIKLCSDLPENMSVTAEMLRPFLEGWTMKQIIEAKRLFVADLKILKNLPFLPNRKICAPIALFFVTGDKQFVPIAIQLFQDIAPNNPVFLPSDPPFTWLLAKMWFNNADATIHQAVHHFCFTHLMMESVCVAMHRSLSPSHPVYKLLAPHLIFLPIVNARGLDQLISADESWVEKTTMIGRDGMFELMRRGVDQWKMDVHGTFPKELESRGLLDTRLIPNYGYRDDGMLIYKAIEAYVNKIIFFYYDSLEKVNSDAEIQNFAKELTLSKDDGGAGLKGVPGKPVVKNGIEVWKSFRRAEDIAMVCISTIFTTTAQHAALNFPQYNEYAFPPNYPAVLTGDPPRNKSTRTEEDIVNALPDKATSLEIMTMTKLFSTRPSKSLSHFDFKTQYDPVAVDAENQLRKDLESAHLKIMERNNEREHIVKYFYLDPENIPNYISI